MARPASLTTVTPEPVAPKVKKPGAREGKRAVAFWIDEADHEEFSVALIRAKMTVQAVGEQMLKDWMREQGIRSARR